MNFKKLINKLVSSKDDKTKKKLKNNYEFDALPDFPRQDSKLSPSSVPDSTIYNNTINSENEPEEDCKTNGDRQCKNNKKPNKTPEHEEKSNFSSNQKDEYFEEPQKTNSSGAPSNIQYTNLVLNGCGNVQFGNQYKYTQVNVEKYMHAQPSQMSSARIFQKTEAIKGLLKCKDKIGTAHINFLSTHFGSKWRDIGVMLELTGGELDSICERYKGHQERGFQMLKIWWQKKGEKVTVGELVKKLWDGHVDVAKEAVHKLSLDIDNLK